MPYSLKKPDVLIDFHENNFDELSCLGTELYQYLWTKIEEGRYGAVVYVDGYIVWLKDSKIFILFDMVYAV